MSPNTEKKLWAALLILVGVAMALSPASDFAVYYDAAVRLRVLGWEAVYEPDNLTPFKYHPVVLYLFWPFSFLPFLWAKLVWTVANLWFLSDGTRRFRQTWGFSWGVASLSLLCVIHALTWQIKFLNVTLLLFWCLSFSGEQTTKYWRAGLATSLLILIKPFWIPLLLWQFATRKTKELMWALVFLAVLGMAPFIVAPKAHLLEFWWASLADPLHAHNFPKNDNQTWFGLWYRYSGGTTLWIVWGLGAGLSFLAWMASWWTGRRTARGGWGLVSLVPFILFAAPLSWIHHQIWLLPLFAVWIQRKGEWGLLGIVWLLLNGTGELALGRGGFIWAHQAGVPLVGFLLLQWVAWRFRFRSSVLR